MEAFVYTYFFKFYFTFEIYLYIEHVLLKELLRGETLNYRSGAVAKELLYFEASDFEAFCNTEW